MKNTILFLILFCSIGISFAQVGIGTVAPDNSSILDITATDKGILIPRVSLIDVTNIVNPVNNPATGLLVYNTNAIVTGGDNVGFYYFNGMRWVKFDIDDDINTNLKDIGIISAFPGVTYPNDMYLPLDGGTFNDVDYPEFATFIVSLDSDVVTNNGNGTFTLGNWNNNGSFLRGQGGNAFPIGSTQGDATKQPNNIFRTSPISLNTNTSGSHNHTYQRAVTSGGVTFGASGQRVFTQTNAATSSSGNHNHSVNVPQLLITGGDIETRPINRSITWVIKVKPSASSISNLTINNITDIGTDDQTIDKLNLNGSTLEISLEDDGVVDETLDLSSLQDGTGTDNQTIDTFNFNTGTNILTIEVEDDGVAPQTVNLSTLQDGTGTDNQTIDSFNFNTGTNILTLEVEDDGIAPQTVNLSTLQDGIGTDDQIIDKLNLNGTTLEISLENDGVVDETVDLSSLQDGQNTLDQAYNQGGAGAGRVITVDSGAIDINANDNSPNGVEITKTNDIGNALFVENTSTYSLQSRAPIRTANASTDMNVEINKYETGTGYNTGLLVEETDATNTFNFGVAVKYTTVGTGNYVSQNYGYFYDVTYNGAGSGRIYGLKAEIEGSGGAPKYGTHISIPSSSGGNHFGVYSDVQNSGGYAGYFIGRTSLGEGTTNRYTMPAVDGGAGEVLTAAGDGTTSWVAPGAGAIAINDLTDAKTVSRSVYLGTGSGNSDNSGDKQNSALGNNALTNSNSGIQNVAIGESTMLSNSSGERNTAVGQSAMRLNQTGNRNTAVGEDALYNNSSGSNNVAIGNRAGYNETGSNKLYIESSNADANSALIYGEFDNNILRTNGELQIGNPTATGYALPTTDGAAGEVLTAAGDGTTSWATVGSTTPSIINVNTSAVTSIPSTSTWTLIPFDTENIDTNSEFNTTTSRFTATTGGYYRVYVKASVAYDDFIQIGLFVGGVVTATAERLMDTGGGRSVTIDEILHLNISDTIDIQALSIFSGTNVLPGTTNRGTTLQIHKIN